MLHKAVGREQDQLVVVPNNVFHDRIDLNLALEELKPVTVLSNLGPLVTPDPKQ